MFPVKGTALVAGRVVLVVFPGCIFHEGPEKRRQQVFFILQGCPGNFFLPGCFLLHRKEGARYGGHIPSCRGAGVENEKGNGKSMNGVIGWGNFVPAGHDYGRYVGKICAFQGHCLPVLLGNAAFCS